MIAYHITLRKSVPNILARGLQPRLGPRAKELGEVEKVVFLYKTKKDCKDGLQGWFGGCFFGDDIEEMVILELNLGKDILASKEQDGEFLVLELISERAIKKIWTKDFNDDITDIFEAAIINIPIIDIENMNSDSE
jgi:hypothetical protein